MSHNTSFVKHSPTSLLEKIALHGFTQPSAIVAHARLARPLEPAHVRAALVSARLRWPRLASRVHTRLGTPIAFVTAEDAIIPVHEHALLTAESLLTVPDLRREPPVCVHLAGAELVLHAHHAVLDGAGALQLARHLAQPEPTLPAPTRARRSRFEWPTSRRLPADAFGCDARLDGAFVDLPIDSDSFVLPRGFSDYRQRARAAGSTFSQWMTARLLEAFARYGSARGEPAAARGVLLAAARPSAPGRYAATQIPIEASVDELVDRGALHASIARQLRRRHAPSPLAMALFYLGRRVRPPQRRGPFHARSVHFTYSDLSHWDLARVLLRDNALLDLRVLVTPSHPEHAGLTVTRIGDALHLVLLATRGVVALRSLREHLLTTLEER